MAARAEYIARLSAAAARTHADIACERETLSIAYAPNVEDGDILRALRKARDVDMRRMTTSAGVHRDDVRFCVDGRELRLFGSQGQQRTAALSVRLAELDVVKEESGEAPVLLLDDVMSELDPERRRRLLAHLDGVQTIVTCTDIADIAGGGNGDFHCVRAVAAFGLHGHAAEIRAPADQFAVLPGAVRTARTAEVDRFQQIGLALRVVARQHCNARAGPELRARVIAVIGKLKGQYAHGDPFKKYPERGGRNPAVRRHAARKGGSTLQDGKGGPRNHFAASVGTERDCAGRLNAKA